MQTFFVGSNVPNSHFSGCVLRFMVTLFLRFPVVLSWVYHHLQSAITNVITNTRMRFIYAKK